MSLRITLLLIGLVTFVIMPFVIWESAFIVFSHEVLSAEQSFMWIALSVVVLLALDILLPIPSSLVSVAAGAYLGLGVGAVANITGMTLGCLLGYLLGYWLGNEGKYRLVTAQDEERIKGFYQRYGAATLVIARPVPVLAEVSVIMAGVSRNGYLTMLAYAVPANIGISIAYAATGYYSMQVNSFLLAFVGAMVLPGLMYGVVRLIKN